MEITVVAKERAIIKLNEHLGGSQGKHVIEAISPLILSLAISSSPPEGAYKVTNIYVNSEGKLIVEYEI